MFEKIVHKTILVQAGPGLSVKNNTFLIFNMTMILLIEKDVL